MNMPGIPPLLPPQHPTHDLVLVDAPLRVVVVEEDPVLMLRVPEEDLDASPVLDSVPVRVVEVVKRGERVGEGVGEVESVALGEREREEVGVGDSVLFGDRVEEGEGVGVRDGKGVRVPVIRGENVEEVVEEAVTVKLFRGVAEERRAVVVGVGEGSNWASKDAAATKKVSTSVNIISVHYA